MPNILEKQLVDVINYYRDSDDNSDEQAQLIFDIVKELVENNSADSGSEHVINLNELITEPELASMYVISLCVMRNLPKVAIYLLDNGADPNLARKFDGKTALHLAVDGRKLEFIKILSRYDTDFNIKCDSGLTPLHSACESIMPSAELLEVVKFIIEQGADVNSVDIEKDSILHSAVGFGNNDIVKLLLDNKADLSLKDEDGKTPLESLEGEDMEDTVQVFKDHAQEIVSKKIIIEIDISNKQKNKIKAYMRNRPRIGGFRNG